jgi:hypothetical protein
MTKHSQPTPTQPTTMPVPGAPKPKTYRFTDWAAF